MKAGETLRTVVLGGLAAVVVASPTSAFAAGDEGSAWWRAVDATVWDAGPSAGVRRSAGTVPASPVVFGQGVDPAAGLVAETCDDGAGCGDGLSCGDGLLCGDGLGCGESVGCGEGVAATAPPLWASEPLLGDWGGARTRWEQAKLLDVDLPLTQFYQGNASGGRRQRFAYGGKMDYFFTGVGGLVVMHAETRFGEDVNFAAAPFAPVNVNMLYPDFSHTTAITGLMFNVPLVESQEWILSFGKINSLDNWNLLYPMAGRGVDGFMNVSNVLPLSLARTVPLSTLGASVTKLHDGQVQAVLQIHDSNNTPTTSGVSELFDNGANLLAYYRLGTRNGGHAAAATWASGDFTALDPGGWILVPGEPIVPPVGSNPWSAHYIVDQNLWTDGGNAQRKVYFYSQLGLADQQLTPIEWTWSGSLEAVGLSRRRPRDRMGAGVFYSGLSGDFRSLLAPVLAYDDAFGGEVYYNAAVSRWFRLTTDLQVIEPADSRNATAVAVGLRLKNEF